MDGGQGAVKVQLRTLFDAMMDTNPRSTEATSCRESPSPAAASSPAVGGGAGRPISIEGLFADEAFRRAEFPVAARAAYFAHAGVCPLPNRVAQAVQQYATVATTDDQEMTVPEEWWTETRGKAAALLGCPGEEIALVGPTSLGLSLVAAGLPFRSGDRILCYFDDYPTNVYPWLGLRAKGVEVDFLRVPELGRIEPEIVLGQVKDRTRLVALASCHFLTGWRIDAGAIGRALRERGIWFCLDGIQTLGAFPMAAGDVDFLAADAHKWMLGPSAAGILYVRRELQALLAPVVVGWHNVSCPGFVTQAELVLSPDARRYEAGSANLLGAVGLRAALDLLAAVGVSAIAAELLRKRARLVAGLRERSWRIWHAEAPAANASGIVTFWDPASDMGVVHRRLRAEGLITSLRQDAAGQRYVRVSPHFYNTDAELDRLLEVLRSAGR